MCRWDEFLNPSRKNSLRDKFKYVLYIVRVTLQYYMYYSITLQYYMYYIAQAYFLCPTENQAIDILVQLGIVAGKSYRVEWIPVSSNVAEMLFSRAKLTVGSLRTSLTPLHLEAILFLFVNNKY